jgi:hypothetical protein
MKTVPVVNLNGNSKQSLVDEAMAIHHALDAAIKLISASDLTHGRNFQTITRLVGLGVHDQARAERAEEYKWLAVKSQEYLDLALAIDEQGR